MNGTDGHNDICMDSGLCMSTSGWFSTVGTPTESLRSVGSMSISAEGIWLTMLIIVPLGERLHRCAASNILLTRLALMFHRPNWKGQGLSPTMQLQYGLTQRCKAHMLTRHLVQTGYSFNILQCNANNGSFCCRSGSSEAGRPLLSLRFMAIDSRKGQLL